MRAKQRPYMLRQFGKNGKGGPDTPEGQQRARFDDLKMRMDRASFYGSLVIDESSAQSAVPPPGAPAVPALNDGARPEQEGWMQDKGEAGVVPDCPGVSIEGSTCAETLGMTFNDSICQSPCGGPKEETKAVRIEMPEEMSDFSSLMTGEDFIYDTKRTKETNRTSLCINDRGLCGNGGAERADTNGGGSVIFSTTIADSAAHTGGPTGYNVPVLRQRSTEAPAVAPAMALNLEERRNRMSRLSSMMEKELRSLQEHYLTQHRRITDKYEALISKAINSNGGMRSGLAYEPAETMRLSECPRERLVRSDAPMFQANVLGKALALQTVPFASLPPSPVKIAEASFSEVFRVGSLIYKIIAFNECFTIDIFHKEVAVLTALCDEDCVVRLRDAFLLEGAFAPAYLAAWHAFPNPENSDPAGYAAGQQFGCIVMEECGVDLESYNFSCAQEVADFVAKLSAALMTLQIKYAFEHRDLHWGNILIRNGEVFIIDLSFSRLEVSLSRILANRRKMAGSSAATEVEGAPGAERGLIYTDLESHAWLFEGDGSIDEQFEIYRQMRVDVAGDWERFCPCTNGRWMGYVLRKLQAKLSAMPEPEEARIARATLAAMLRRLLRFGWNAAFVKWCSQKALCCQPKAKSIPGVRGRGRPRKIRNS